MSLLTDSLRGLKDLYGRYTSASQSKSDWETVRVIADARFPTAEICVLDPQFRIVGMATGIFDGDLRPGLYVLQYKTGRTVKEIEVRVKPGQSEQIIEPPKLETRSAAPLADTRSGERFGDTAMEHSRTVHETISPADGQLFVFIRDSAADNPNNQDAQNRLFDVELFAFDGSMSMRLADHGVSSPDGKWHACNIALPSDCYGLRCRTDEDSSLAQSIVISEGWQTQVFYAPRTYGTAIPTRGPDIANAAVLMARLGQGFVRNDERLAWTEAARVSLAGQQAAAPVSTFKKAIESGRQVRSDLASADRSVLLDILSEKFANPMLGILGGHLLLLERELDVQLLQEVVDNLNALVPHHPDVLALQSVLNRGERQAIGPPPMLRSSWRLFVDSTLENPEVIPEDSYAARVVRRTWGSGAWLVWKEPNTPEVVPQAQPISRAPAAHVRPPGTDQSIESTLAAILTVIKPSLPRHSLDRYLEWQAQRLGLDDVQRRILSYLASTAFQQDCSTGFEQSDAAGFKTSVKNWLSSLLGRSAPLTVEQLRVWYQEDVKQLLSLPNALKALAVPRSLLESSVRRLGASLTGETIMTDPRVCFDRILPGELNIVRPTSPVSGARTRAAFEWAKLWPLGQPLRVSFLGGTEEQRNIVKRFAPQWSEHGNIKLVFGNDSNAEIRISFVSTDGAWSYIGTDCKSIPVGQPTMNLGWQDEGVVLHEFGHAIGLIHEHQNPQGGIKWNKPAVYRDLAGPPNFWDEATVDRNLFDTYDRDQVNATTVDKDSIMLYQIPASWTLEGFSSGANEKLSKTDKEFAKDPRNYPFSGTRQPP